MINLFQYMIQIEIFFALRISFMIDAKFSITVHHQMDLEFKMLYCEKSNNLNRIIKYFKLVISMKENLVTIASEAQSVKKDLLYQLISLINH